MHEDELEALREEAALLRRRVRQLERTAATTQEMYERGKCVMSRIRARLEAQVQAHRATESELRAAKVHAEAASEAKSRFVAVMSHELRTPLNGLVGACELLLGNDVSEDQRDLAEIIDSSARSLVAVINDVLDFSRIEAGALQIDAAPLDLATVTEEVVDLHRHAVIGKDVELALELDPRLPRSVSGDAKRIRQVLHNLLHNAIKFTLEGRVVVRVLAKDGVTTFEVADTGIGIPIRALTSLFKAFTQADETTTRQFGGSGLGLTITRRLVELMGGTIEVESQTGVGSTFRVRLPLVPTATAHDGGADHALAPGFDAQVLVVDDNATNLFVTRRMLERLGCTVHTAGDGVQAVDAVRLHPFDLVFLDASMPTMDGYAAARAIRSMDGPMADVPIICLTAHVFQRSIDTALAAGMNAHLAKPVCMKGLASALQEFVACHRGPEPQTGQVSGLV